MPATIAAPPALRGAGFALAGLCAAFALAAGALAPEAAFAGALAALGYAAAAWVLAVGADRFVPAAWGAAAAFAASLLGIAAAPLLGLVLLPAAAARAGGRPGFSARLIAFSLFGLGVGAVLAPASAPDALGLVLALGLAGAALSSAFWPRERSRAAASETQRLRNALKEAQTQVETLRAGLTARAADLGHELRTPISQMMSFAESAGVFGPLTARQAEYLGLIQMVGRSALRLATWLMDFAQIESGRYPFEPERFDPHPTIAETLRLIGPEAERREIRVSLEEPGAPLRIEADPHALRQIAQNLLVNAVKFAPQGGSVIARLRADGETLVLEVEDSGRGIPEEERQRLKERFARGAAARAQDGVVDGVGLGLAIVAGLTELHGGRLSFHEGAALGGALARVELPVIIE